MYAQSILKQIQRSAMNQVGRSKASMVNAEWLLKGRFTTAEIDRFAQQASRHGLNPALIQKQQDSSAVKNTARFETMNVHDLTVTTFPLPALIPDRSLNDSVAARFIFELYGTFAYVMLHNLDILQPLVKWAQGRIEDADLDGDTLPLLAKSRVVRDTHRMLAQLFLIHLHRKSSEWVLVHVAFTELLPGIPSWALRGILDDLDRYFEFDIAANRVEPGT